MVPGDVVCLATDIFPDEVGKMKFLVLYLGVYLYAVAYGNRYPLRGSKDNVLSSTLAENVSDVSVTR